MGIARSHSALMLLNGSLLVGVLFCDIGLMTPHNNMVQHISCQGCILLWVDGNKTLHQTYCFSNAKLDTPKGTHIYVHTKELCMIALFIGQEDFIIAGLHQMPLGLFQ